MRSERPSPGQAKSGSSELRFHLAVQKSRAIVFLTAGVVGLASQQLGLVRFRLLDGLVLMAVAVASPAVFSWLYRRRDGRGSFAPLTVAWQIFDLATITAAVLMSGGLASPWYVWYVTTVGAAAFIAGMRGVRWATAGSVVFYIGALMLGGQIGGTIDTWALAAGRMLFLFAASIFLLYGVTQLRRRELLIRELRSEDSRRIEEMERLTQDLDAANEKLREMLLTDPLTGLHNRRYIEERILEDVAIVRRAYADDAGERRRTTNIDLGMLMIDIDHFKQVNDVFGHAAGDRLLARAAGVLRRAVRTHDTVIRWGGDEFFALVRRTDHASLLTVAERLVEEMKSEPFDLGEGARASLTCSVGWSYYPFAATQVEAVRWQDILRLADAALYLAKQNGRDLAVGVLPVGTLDPGDLPRVAQSVRWGVERDLVRLVSRRTPLQLIAVEPTITEAPPPS